MLDVKEIQEILPHRYPMLMIDRVLEIVGGEYSVALKNITANEEVFEGHFPGNPVFPGIMIIEAMKTMNHVPSTENGTVSKIFVKDGEPVEFGQPLISVK